ncbi:MAG: hypothetical protein IK060_05410 [Methanomicrobium sp.]|nr:hypothetical protein [Methanomicrobium sp.]MBR6497828.1 hypothetical protein [Methanomicrobium sp.]
MEIKKEDAALLVSVMVIGIVCGALITFLAVSAGHADNSPDPIVGKWTGTTSFAYVFSLQSNIIFYDDNTGNVVFDLSTPVLGAQKAGFDFSWEKTDKNKYSVTNGAVTLPFTMSEKKGTITAIISPKAIGYDIGVDVAAFDLKYVKV